MEDSNNELAKLFTNIDSVYDDLVNGKLSSSSLEGQEKLKSALVDAERAVNFVNELELFSDNEEIDDVHTESVKYLLLPAFMGYFLYRQQGSDRPTVLKKSKIYFENFLKLSSKYNFVRKGDDLPLQPSQISSISNPEKRRMEKIKRFNYEKTLTQSLNAAKEGFLASRDEEEQRNYFLNYYQHWIFRVEEELACLKEEEKLIEMRPAFLEDKKKEQDEEKWTSTASPNLPFIITKDKIQKAVFGAGYPSLPTYTIEEFSDQMHDKYHKPQTTEKNPGDESKNEDEEESEEAVKKARNWDDWKDTHRRGYGNRANRS